MEPIRVSPELKALLEQLLKPVAPSPHLTEGELHWNECKRHIADILSRRIV